MAAPTPMGLPDAKEVGNVIIALPQDFRLIMYVLIVIIIIMVVERGIAAWGMRQERKDMWAVANKFSDAAKEFSDQTDKLVIELQVLRSLASRVEADAGRN